MSFVKSKSCCSAGSFCFACVPCPGLLQKGLTKPGSGCLHDRSPDGCEGLERGLGWRRDMVGRGDGGRDLERKGKCGSTQSKPCHMFQSAGICPPVQTRKLCNRLLIRESARWKTECQLGAEGSCWCVCGNTVTWCPRLGKQICQRIAGGTFWSLQTDPMRVRFLGVTKGLRRYYYLSCWCDKTSPGTLTHEKIRARERPVASNSYHLSLRRIHSKSPCCSDVIPFNGHSSARVSPNISFNSHIEGVWKEWMLDQGV